MAKDKSVDAPAVEPEIDAVAPSVATAPELPIGPSIAAAASTVASPSDPQKQVAAFNKKLLGHTGTHQAPGGFTVITK